MKAPKPFWALLLASPAAIAAPCQQLARQAGIVFLQQGFLPTLQQLQPQERQCAGDPEFDYLLGSSLLHTGNPAEASWALERVTANNPRHGGAWLDLAEAYWRMGDAQRAREALQHAIMLNPPALARERILALQDALHDMQTPWHSAAYTTLELGQDSNVNSASSLAVIGIPSLGNLPFALDPGSMRRASPYRDLELGGVLDWKASAGSEYYLLPKLKTRDYTTLHQFNRDIYTMQAGQRQRFAKGDLITSVQIEKQWLGGRPFLLTRGVGTEWRSEVWSKSLLRLSGQYTGNRYADPSQNSNDADQYSVGVTLSQWFDHDRGRATLALIRSTEQATRPRAYGDKRSALLYAEVDYQLPGDWNGLFSVAHEADDYQRTDPLFLQVRSERKWSYSLGLSRVVARNYLLSGTLTTIRNDSNIPVYGYQRRICSISVRRDF